MLGASSSQRPTGSLVATDTTSQRQAVALEVQHHMVPVYATQQLANPRPCDLSDVAQPVRVELDTERTHPGSSEALNSHVHP